VLENLFLIQQLCTTVIHSTALNSSDNLPSYPSDNHHSSDDVYCKLTVTDCDRRSIHLGW